MIQLIVPKDVTWITHGGQVVQGPESLFYDSATLTIDSVETVAKSGCYILQASGDAERISEFLPQETANFPLIVCMFIVLAFNWLLKSI